MIRLLILASIATASGCSFSRQANPAVLDRLSAIDQIQIRNVALTDPADIDRFREIYANASWERYFATMPADIVSVSCIQDGSEALRLRYGGGCLWESTGDRIGRLDPEDAAWLKLNVGDKLDVVGHIL